jgi:hypothetical protein
MGEGSDDRNDGKKKSGKLIPFPGGKEAGTDYVLGQVGDVPTPSIVDPVEIEAENRDREEFVANHDLVLKTDPGTPTHETIDAILKEIAREVAHLEFERRKASRSGFNTAPFSSTKINSLRSFGELLLKRKAASLTETLDLKSPRMKALFQLWMELFHDSMEKAGVSPEEISMVFETMKSDLPAWERKMESL